MLPTDLFASDDRSTVANEASRTKRFESADENRETMPMFPFETEYPGVNGSVGPTFRNV